MRNRYRLSFSNLHAHLVDVEARFEGAGEGDRDLLFHMAAWSPGSYLIREYARHVEELQAIDESGRPLSVEKVEKATWRVRPAGGRDVILRYRVYGWELTVRTSHIDATHAFLNGPPTYLWLAERRGEPAEVEVEAPAGWHVATGLAGGPDRFRARDLDELLDCPLHLGPEPIVEFEAAGRPARLAVWGRPDAGGPFERPLAQLVSDLPRIASVFAELFGVVPYDVYTFILMLSPNAYGGLEHRNSCALLHSPFAFTQRKSYEELLELCAHEYFHLWNVKRIRPRPLAQVDYGRENYTRSLWILEGVTSYYDRLALRRAGLLTARRYLDKLAEDWGKLLSTPGRARQSLEEASFDAWVKFYRPDENSVNSTVSYYLKGGLVAACLDLEIRRRTAGRRSLDDVMRFLWKHYGEPDRGFEDAETQRLFERAVELDLGEFFDRYVRGREDPDLGGLLTHAGLSLKGSWSREGDVEPPAGGPAWLGVTTKSERGRVLVASSLRGGPAERHGLYAGDEILALDGFRVDESSLGKRLLSRRPGDRVRFTVFRRDELVDVEVTLAARPHDKFEITPFESPSADEKAFYRAWLGEAHPKS